MLRSNIVFASLIAFAGVVTVKNSRAETLERPWLFVEDPTTPDTGRAIVYSRLTYGSTASKEGPIRPFAANLSRQGGMIELGAEAGIAHRVSLSATVTSVGFIEGTVGAAATGGVRVVVLQQPNYGLTLSGGVLREATGKVGIWSRANFAVDVDRLRLASTVHAERVFAQGRDDIDLLVSLGATVRLHELFRLGVEYVGQELEGAFEEDEAEGGIRHFIGPTAALELNDHKFIVSGGPGFGLSSESSGLTARLNVSVVF